MYFHMFNFCTIQPVRKYFNNEIFAIYGTCITSKPLPMKTFKLNPIHVCTCVRCKFISVLTCTTFSLICVIASSLCCSCSLACWREDCATPTDDWRLSSWCCFGAAESCSLSDFSSLSSLHNKIHHIVHTMNHKINHSDQWKIRKSLVLHTYI